MYLKNLLRYKLLKILLWQLNIILEKRKLYNLHSTSICNDTCERCHIRLNIKVRSISGIILFPIKELEHQLKLNGTVKVCLKVISTIKEIIRKINNITFNKIYH